MAPPPSGEFSIRLTKPFSTLPSLPEPTYEPLTQNPPSPPPQNLIRPSTTNTPSSHSRHNTDRKNRIHRRAQPPRHRKSHHPRWCTKPDYLDQAGGGSSVPIPLPLPLPSPLLPSPLLPSPFPLCSLPSPLSLLSLSQANIHAATTSTSSSPSSSNSKVSPQTRRRMSMGSIRGLC